MSDTILLNYMLTFLSTEIEESGNHGYGDDEGTELPNGGDVTSSE